MRVSTQSHYIDTERADFSLSQKNPLLRGENLR